MKKLLTGVYAAPAGAMLAAFGIVLLIANGIRLLDNARAMNWPEAPGVVREVPVVERTNGQGYASSVIYDYIVNGTEYHHARVWLDQAMLRTRSATRAEALTQQYRPGQPVMVHYDPENPAYGVLVTAPRPIQLLLTSAGLVLAVIGSAVALLSVPGDEHETGLRPGRTVYTLS